MNIVVVTDSSIAVDIVGIIELKWKPCTKPMNLLPDLIEETNKTKQNKHKLKTQFNREFKAHRNISINRSLRKCTESSISSVEMIVLFFFFFLLSGYVFSIIYPICWSKNCGKIIIRNLLIGLHALIRRTQLIK